MGDIKITYETLFEILRRERGSETLSELSPSFFKDISVYIKEKERIVSEKIGGEFFGESEVEMAQKQLSNAKRIIESIYSRRERKIVDMALNKTRVGEMPLRGLLDEEKEIFEDAVEMLSKYRNLLVSDIVKKDKLRVGRSDIKENVPVQEKVIEKEEVKEAEIKSAVKFVKDVDVFIGKDLAEHGPYKAGEKADLDPDIAKVLVNRGEAVEESGE